MGPKKFTYSSKIKYNESAIFLLIVESPSKCSKIESFLGNNYACIASMGHLQHINSMKDIDSNNNYNPSFKVIEDKKSYISQMSKIISRFAKDNIILATDDDREGEAIAWHICRLFSLDIERTKRILFHEITKNAITEAIKKPVTINMNLVQAQFSRQILDIIVGFKISPFLWKYLYNDKENTLSAGRCQTPALRLVYDSHNNNNNDINLTYKTVGYFTMHNLAFNLNKKIESEENIKDFLNKSKSFNHRLTIGDGKKSSTSPPSPFSTSKLLQTAGNMFNISPKHIMNICQKLYQAGYITYMRTESTKYSKVFIEGVNDYIISKYGPEYGNINDNIINKNINNPHEAIRVTNLNNTYAINDKDPFLSKIYKLIYTNTIESCMKPYTANITIVKITSPFKEHYYEYKNEIPIYYGWKIIKLNTENIDTTKGMLLYFKSICTSTNNIEYKKIEACVNITTNTHYYSEHSLINKLESLGIGRPSTFATIVDVIQSRNYVEKKNIDAKEINVKEYELLDNKIINCINKPKKYGEEKNKLVITNIGILTTDFLINNFDSLFSYDYTEKMETKLDEISIGKISEWYYLCNDCDNEIKDISKRIKNIKKHSFKLDDNYDIVFEKYGPCIRGLDENNEQKYYKIKNDIALNMDKIVNNEYTYDELVEKEDDLFLGKHNDIDVYKKLGKYGAYLEYNGKTKTLKGIKKEFREIKLNDVIDLLNSDDKNPNIFREFTPYLSVRKGKYGAYAYFKKNEMRKPNFYNIKKFNENYLDCDKESFINWICNNYDTKPEDFV